MYHQDIGPQVVDGPPIRILLADLVGGVVDVVLVARRLGPCRHLNPRSRCLLNGVGEIDAERVSGNPPVQRGAGGAVLVWRAATLRGRCGRKTPWSA